MSSFYTIQEIKRFPNGSILSEMPVRGKIIYVGEKTERKGPNGTFESQFIRIADPDKTKEEGAETIGIDADHEFTFSNEDKFRTVILTCTEGPRGARGVKVRVYENGREKEKQLKVTRSAKIEFEDGKPAAKETQKPRPEPAEEVRPKKAAPEPEEEPEKNTREIRPETRGAEEDAAASEEASRKATVARMKSILGRMVNLHTISFDAAVAMANNVKERHGYAVSPQVISIWSDMYFREIVRRGFSENKSFPLSIEDLPFRGSPLSELLPEFEKQIDENRKREIELRKQMEAEYDPDE